MYAIFHPPNDWSSAGKWRSRLAFLMVELLYYQLGRAAFVGHGRFHGLLFTYPALQEGVLIVLQLYLVVQRFRL